MAYTTIKKSGLFFNSKDYNGNSGTQSLTGIGFQPDFVWVKTRSGAAENHGLTDSVRGATKTLYSNSDNTEATCATCLTSFDSDGFSMGSSDQFNGTSGRTYICWNWKAGTTSGITTNGSTTITPSSYSFNQTSGTSIIKYTGNGTTGAKYPHGLGVTPQVVIVKCLDSASVWWNVHHVSIGDNSELYLNDTSAAPSSTANGTTPDAVNIALEGTSTTHNGSGSNYIAYIFAQKTGFSKFGKYTGNGNADGTFVYCGFKPALVIAKSITSGNAQNWVMFDKSRDGYNINNDELMPNLSSNENDGQTYTYIDLLSNGFKWRAGDANKNLASNEYVYFAWAEQPIVGDNPATAR